MRNQTKYLFVYLCVLYLLIASVVQPAQAQQEASTNTSDIAQLEQALVDQMLAPIALYPDTLLSHILVASTYPLEVIQAARWRAANQDLNEQQAFNAVEDKGWDPSVQALVPFDDLLQRLSEDLDWLQSLGSAFLINEQQVLTSVQSLRQKAHDQGNLVANDYVNVEQKQEQIVIETVRKEVVYVPYYDTRVVYGDWWWQNHQPYYWHRPSQSIFNAGLYWSTGFNIRPSFYFGGFHWHNRHVVANYHYRNHAKKYWSNGHNNRQVVRVKEYPRWSHNQQHRRGAQYRVNGQRIVRSINGGSKTKGYQQIDKQRVLNISNYANKYNRNKAIRVKQALGEQQQSVLQTKTMKVNKPVSNQQRIINQSKNRQIQRLSNDYRPKSTAKFEPRQNNSRQSQKYTALNTKANKEEHYSVKTQNKISTYKTNNNKTKNFHTSSNKQNKSRPIKVLRQNKNSHRSQRKIQ